MKLEKKHFELFKKYCKEYIDKFELNEWRVYYSFCDKYSDAIAAIALNEDYAVVDIYLSTNLEFIKNEKELISQSKSTAKHEIIHLLIGRFSSFTKKRYISEMDRYREEEFLVRKLQGLIK